MTIVVVRSLQTLMIHFNCLFVCSLTQNAAFHAIVQVIDFLDEATIKKTIIPKTKQVFEINSGVQAQANTLTCVERIIENLDKAEILDHVLPMLLNAKLGEPLVLVPAMSEFLPLYLLRFPGFSHG